MTNAMSHLKRLLAVAVLATLAACANPVTRVEAVDTRPELAIANAPRGAVLLVNGVMIGPADAYDGAKATLRLDRGLHEVEIRQAGIAVHRETVVLADGMTRTIRVR